MLVIPIEAAAQSAQIHPTLLQGMIEAKVLTAFVALPVVLAHPPRELRRPDDPPMFVRTSGVFALAPVEAAAIIAGYRTEVNRLFEYGDYLPSGQYKNIRPLLLKTPVFPEPTHLRVNLDEVRRILSKKTPTDAEPAITGQWPWGNYETNLLQQLAKAVNRFWINYDPNDPTTAPTSEQVADWLTKNRVSRRVAEIMAQIIRPEGLPRGPRR